jgi:hypothetical protein
MGAPVVMYNQFTLADVLARCSTLGLDPYVLLNRVDEPSGDDGGDLVRALLMEDDDDAPQASEIAESWQPLLLAVRKYPRALAHEANPAWRNAEGELRALDRHKYRSVHVIRPGAVRTFGCRFEKPARWDGETMPATDVGTTGTYDELVKTLQAALLRTVGGEEYLAPAPETRALGVLATSMAAILRQDFASLAWLHRGKRARPMIRPDVYQAAVEGMGLGKFYQTVRRLLEIDHHEHEPILTAWPTTISTPRDIAFLSLRGEGEEQYITLNAPRF